MSIFAVADLHLPFGAGKPMDIFKGWENYTQKLETNWKTLVKPEDTVVIAGDVSWALKLEETFKDFEFLERLPGKKIIIKGNHDFWWSTVTKIENYLKENNFKSIEILLNSAKKIGNICICGTRGWLYRASEEFDKKILAREVGRLRFSLEYDEKLGGEPIVFMHYPPVYGNDESTDIINLLLEKKVKKCYYGHIHGNSAKSKILNGEYKGIDFRLVSCDYINFCPILVRTC